MAKCKKCDYPYAAEGGNCPSCGSWVPARGGYFQDLDFGGGNAKQRQDSVDSKKVSKEKIKEFSYVGRNLEDLNELFNSQSDDFLFGIEILDLSNNKIKDLNPLIRLKSSRAKFPKLRELHLSGNLIEELPEKIIDVFGGSLEIIDLSNNKISHLPKNFSKLFHYKLDLNLENNQINSFPRIEFDLEQTKKEPLHVISISLNLNNNPIGSINKNLLDFMVEIQTAFDIPKVTYMPYRKRFLFLNLPEKLIEEKEKLYSIQKDFEVGVPDEILEYVRKEVKNDITDLTNTANNEMLDKAFKYYNYFIKNHGVNIKFGTDEFKTSFDGTTYKTRLKFTGRYYKSSPGTILEETFYYIEEISARENLSIPFYSNINISTWINKHLNCSIDVKHFIMDKDLKYIYRENQSSNVSESEEGSTFKGILNLALVALLAFGLLYGFYKLITLIF